MLLISDKAVCGVFVRMYVCMSSAHPFVCIIIIGLGHQTRPGTQLPFLFCDGEFSCQWNRGFPNIPYEPHIFLNIVSHCAVTRLLSSVTYRIHIYSISKLGYHTIT